MELWTWNIFEQSVFINKKFTLKNKTKKLFDPFLYYCCSNCPRHTYMYDKISIIYFCTTLLDYSVQCEISKTIYIILCQLNLFYLCSVFHVIVQAEFLIKLCFVVPFLRTEMVNGLGIKIFLYG